MKKEAIKSWNGDKIVTFLWNNVKEPKAVMLVAHGMCEHAKRYDEFAKFMNSKGFIVFIPDLRGHGETAGTPDKVCMYPSVNIMEDSIKDLMFFGDMLIKKYKLPLITLGHSYGSFLMQGFLQRYNKQACTILVGSAFMRDATTTLGRVVAKLTKRFKGGDAKAKMIVSLSFGAYENAFPDKNWLTADTKIYNAYMSDPYCQVKPSANFYCSLFNGLKTITSKKELSKISKDVPILITSGAQDPVGGKKVLLVHKLYKKYKEVGLEPELKIWEDGRHEVLNETNRKEVYKFILDFVNKSIKNKKEH